MWVYTCKYTFWSQIGMTLLHTTDKVILHLFLCISCFVWVNIKIFIYRVKSGSWTTKYLLCVGLLQLLGKFIPHNRAESMSWFPAAYTPRLTGQCIQILYRPGIPIWHTEELNLLKMRKVSVKNTSCIRLQSFFLNLKQSAKSWMKGWHWRHFFRETNADFCYFVFEFWWNSRVLL